MAERRMFAKTIIDSDAFLDMPLSAQALYFHLSMRADDEGFVNNPKKIQRMVNASDDDMKVLLAKNFIIIFESGVIVIKHWKIHNYIRGDRIVETKYQDEKSLLEVKENGSYTIGTDLKELQEFEQLDATDKRKKAYRDSSLPYCFEYKIKRAFIGRKCPVCGIELSYSTNLTKPSIQHNIPISKGGEHELSNISIICNSCNSSIRDKTTGELNNLEVAECWDKIIEVERMGVNWFKNPELLNQVDGFLTSDRHMSDICQSNVSIGKDSIGKDSINNNILSGEKSDNEKKSSFSEEICKIINYLNDVLGTRYTTKSKSTNTMIKARLEEGHTVDDFKKVIDSKNKAWKDDPKMVKYLRPETLFRASHFESYLNESSVSEQSDKRKGIVHIDDWTKVDKDGNYHPEW